MKYKSIIIILLLYTILAAPFAAEKQDKKIQAAFITKMVNNHQFDKTELEKLFASVEIKQNILKAMSSPAEGLPWYQYRKIFLTRSRIDGGVKFWKENQETLTAVEKKYGVPAEIIIAIIGVETRYGGNTGNHRVIDALSTLGFAYPKRSKFFLKELESFLLLCRDEKMDPLLPTGSYAGAMGIPQFMPSSFRAYAADFDGDDHRDIWNNKGDVIASIANYFVVHHWKPGEPVTFQVTADDKKYKTALNKGLKPDITIEELKFLNLNIPEQLDKSIEAKLLSFENKNDDELWIGLQNFYVITRYNHSPLYAMAVYQLAQAIREKKT